MKFATAKEIIQLLEDNDIYSAVGNISMNLNGTSVVIKQNDTVGNILQEWLGQFLKEQDIYFRPARGQTFPDFYLSEYDDRNLCEMKTYLANKSPAFDIANFLGYTNSLVSSPYRLDSDYLICSYLSDEFGNISIKEMWCKKVWEIAGPAIDYPLKCQRKNGQIVNIRPVSWMSERSKLRPFSCKEEFLVALYQTHLTYTNQARVSRAWLKQIVDGYQIFCGEDMAYKIDNFW
ncbi:NgoBV family restriction endonuclease [Alkalibaculum sp. M08DMB]|uniref:NgoBV family restriction endonuclease n=1 Tax=Alkalibaculum sporogenes TaxID=2655001 RepID=A0A6A7KAQ1_9FIRM|nr:NgoBV family restriction endonuclease [Alkalibaculum sporogenes]MPW26435.1 NgoBV family restriction endonuclease [Alkalibaculum sporogenes]